VVLPAYNVPEGDTVLSQTNISAAGTSQKRTYACGDTTVQTGSIGDPITFPPLYVTTKGTKILMGAQSIVCAAPESEI
jgi:hypothetical protein